jgi:hypothetical protein
MYSGMRPVARDLISRLFMEAKCITGKNAFFAIMISVDSPSMFHAINNELLIL